MTELQQHRDPPALAPQDVAIARLGEWARAAQAAHQVAGSLVKTSFCPAQFRDKQAEATAAILAGLELGLSPMAALRSFDIISGQATARAITLRAVVQSQGHEMILVESTETRCVMKGRRKGSEEWQKVQWTLDRAKALGLTGKDNWRKQPGAMLVARATSELARLVASDAILGIGVSSEEVDDGVVTDDGTPVAPAVSTGTRRMSRPLKATEPEEPPTDEPAPTVMSEVSRLIALDAPEELPMISQPQMKKLMALYGELGVTDRDERLAEASQFLGHDLSSSNELNKNDASRLINYLELRVQGPGA